MSIVATPTITITNIANDVLGPSASPINLGDVNQRTGNQFGRGRVNLPSSGIGLMSPVVSQHGLVPFPYTFPLTFDVIAGEITYGGGRVKLIT